MGNVIFFPFAKMADFSMIDKKGGSYKITIDQIMEKIASKQPVKIEANHHSIKSVQVLYSPRAMEGSNIEDIRFLLMNLV